MPKVKLTGYVKYDGVRHSPDTILDLSIEDAEHLLNSGVGETVEDEEDFDNESPSEEDEDDTSDDDLEEEVNEDAESGGSGNILQQEDKQPSVGSSKPRRKGKGSRNRS